MIIRTVACINKICTTGLLTTSILSFSPSSSYSSCRGREEKFNGTGGKTNKKDENNDSHEEEDESCPFCRYFLDSPCRSAFQQWRLCVKVCNCCDDK